jgi:hypothetical protein
MKHMLGLVAREVVTLLTIWENKISVHWILKKEEVRWTYVGGTKSRVLTGIGEVDGVVDSTAGDLSKGLRVHGSETRRGALEFTSTTSRDDGVLRAGSTLLDGAGNSTCSEEDAEESTLETDIGEHVG